MKYLVFIVSLIIAIPGLSQKFDLKIDSIIDLEIKRIQKRNVHEIGYTKRACINFGIRTTAYLFWREGGKTSFQKFKDSEYDNNDVHKFRPIVITDSVFFPFYKANSEALNQEQVKSFEYNPDHFVIISHSCFRNFRLFINGTHLSKDFNFFDLREFDSEQIDNSKISKERIEELRLQGWEVDTLYKNTPTKNINYKSNNELKIVEWNEIISKFIDKIESTNKFLEVESNEKK